MKSHEFSFLAELCFHCSALRVCSERSHLQEFHENPGGDGQIQKADAPSDSSIHSTCLKRLSLIITHTYVPRYKKQSGSCRPSPSGWTGGNRTPGWNKCLWKRQSRCDTTALRAEKTNRIMDIVTCKHTHSNRCPFQQQWSWHQQWWLGRRQWWWWRQSTRKEPWPRSETVHVLLETDQRHHWFAWLRGQLVGVDTCLKMPNTDTAGLLSSSVRLRTGLFSASASTSQEHRNKFHRWFVFEQKNTFKHHEKHKTVQPSWIVKAFKTDLCGFEKSLLSRYRSKI